MTFLGISPTELLLVIIILLLILPTSDMAKAGRTIGSFLRKIVKSPTWTMLQRTSQNLRNLPTHLMREAGMDEIQEEFKREAEAIRGLQHAVGNSFKGLKDSSKDLIDKEAEKDTSFASWTTAPEQTIAPPRQDNPQIPEEPTSSQKPGEATTSMATQDAANEDNPGESTSGGEIKKNIEP